MELLDRFLHEVKQQDMVVNYVQVTQRGSLVADYSRLEAKTRLNTWSVSKSVVSVAVGIAMEEGLLGLDDPVCGYFEEYLPENPSPHLLSLTVRNLLAMTTGLSDALFFGDDPLRYRTEDWLGYFFRQDFIRPPGEQFLYCNFNTYLLSCIIEQRAGASLVEYLRHRLFAHLDILSLDWTTCPRGHVHAANGLYLTIDEFTRFGVMLLQSGRYDGKQLVPAAYLREATKNQVPIDPPKNGYGYQFWINPDGKSYRADGKYGQYILVLPDKDAVVAVQSLESKPVFPLVWAYIAELL